MQNNYVTFKVKQGLFIQYFMTIGIKILKKLYIGERMQKYFQIRKGFENNYI